MLKSSGAMALATLASRVLGLVREVVYAAFMGNTAEASAFILAFQVPNLFRRLLGEGALTAAFIPIFKKKEALEGEAAMWRCANAVLSGLVAASGAIALLAVAVISVLLLAGTFQPERRLMLGLLRFMFPYMVLACIAAVLIGMANARGHFFIPALGAAMLNVVMIASVLLLAPRLGTTLAQQIYGLAIGVIVAGIAQVIFQWPTLARDGYHYRWVAPWNDSTVREVVAKMIPGSLGVAAFQINVLFTQTFSFWVDESIVSTFNYAVRLMELPQGMFGISLATYLLPTLSGMAARKEYEEFRSTLRQGLSHLAFANLFAAAISMALAVPIVRLLFERGLFGPDVTIRVALALACLAPGLLMFSMNNILARAFYALNDIKTPMRISVFCLLTNLLLAFLTVRQFRESGLAVANSMTACLNTGLLIYALRKKLSRLDFQPLVSLIARVAAAAVAAGLAAWGSLRIWDAVVGHTSFLAKLGAVFFPAALAFLVYLGAAAALRVPAVTELGQTLRKRLAK